MYKNYFSLKLLNNNKLYLHILFFNEITCTITHSLEVFLSVHCFFILIILNRASLQDLIYVHQQMSVEMKKLNILARAMKHWQTLENNETVSRCTV